MVRHLKFLLSLDSQPLSLMVHSKFRRVCCNSASLGIPGALYWNVLGVTWSPLLQLIQLCFFSLKAPLRLI